MDCKFYRVDWTEVISTGGRLLGGSESPLLLVSFTFFPFCCMWERMSGGGTSVQVSSPGTRSHFHLASGSVHLAVGHSPSPIARCS
jgi:hypothetical protein